MVGWSAIGFFSRRPFPSEYRKYLHYVCISKTSTNITQLAANNSRLWFSFWSHIVIEFRCFQSSLEIFSQKPLVLTLKTWWNFAIAAKLCENDLEPKFSKVWTNTSIFKGLYWLSAASFSPFSPAFGRSFSTLRTSSAVHFWRMDTTNSCAVAVPGSEAKMIEKRTFISFWFPSSYLNFKMWFQS